MERSTRHAVFICILAASSLVMSAGRSQAARPEPPLTLEATIPLPHVSGRIDHMAVDLGRKRLFVAELGNDTVDVVDLGAGKPVERITGLREPQGIGYAAKADVVLVANAGDGTVRLFRGEDLAPVGSIALGDDADNVRIDASDGSAVVGYGNGGLAIIDPSSQAVVAQIGLAAHPEGFQIDPADRRAFVNVPDARQIAIVDLATRRAVDTWRALEARANFPMALDPGGSRLAIVFRSPPRLALFDRHSGARIADVASCGDADDVFFDASRHRIYVSCGSGEIAVFLIETSGVRALPTVQTASSARTSLFVPELDRLFVAKRAGLLGSEAAILVFRPGHS
jgi:hypothetical protein